MVKIYYKLNELSKSPETDIPLVLLIMFFDDIRSCGFWRKWLSTEQKHAGSNMFYLAKEDSIIRLRFEEYIEEEGDPQLILTQKNFTELLDTWDELIKKRVREMIFVEKDGYYTIRPYDKEQDQDILLSNQSNNTHTLNIDINKLKFHDEETKTASYYSGLHHDHLKKLEQRGKIKTSITATHPKGYYQADLLTEGMTSPNHGFFSSGWSQDEVMEKISQIIQIADHPNYTQSYPNLNTYVSYGNKVIDFPIDERVYLRIIIKGESFVQTFFPVFIKHNDQNFLESDSQKKYEPEEIYISNKLNVDVDHILFVDEPYYEGITSTTSYHSGLHHDYLKELEGFGMIEINVTKQHPDGYCQADYSIQHMTSLNHGFFSPNWTRDEVIEKSLEFLAISQDPTRAELYPNLNVYTNYGHEVVDFPIDQYVYIRMIIKNGNMLKTSFPVFIK